MGLDHIKGQLQSTITLKQVVDADLMGRSYIFSGPPGVGKMTTALAFARDLMGSEPLTHPDFSFYRNDQFVLKTSYYLKQLDNQHHQEQIKKYFLYLLTRASRAISLGELKRSYLEIVQEMLRVIHIGSIIDFLKEDKNTKQVLEISKELQSKKKIPIAYVRSVIQDHSQKPSGNYRVSILADFETSSIEAQNAILKLLEEPPDHSIIILTTSNIKALLATILSRAIILNFQPLTSRIMTEIFSSNVDEFHSTLLFMKDEVYQYRLKKKSNVKTFFQDIAPKVQHSHELFNFVDSMDEKNNPETGLYFLEELIEFFRYLLILFQMQIRKSDLNNYMDEYYLDILSRIVSKVHLRDIEQWTGKIAVLYRRIKTGNVKSKMVLPHLLIDISRWFQLSSR